MLNGDRFTDHPIFQPRPADSIGGAKSIVQQQALKAEEITTLTRELPWIASKIYRPSPVVNMNPALSTGEGEGMISRIYQQIAPTPDEVAAAAAQDRKFADKFRNWIEFGKFK